MCHPSLTCSFIRIFFLTYVHIIYISRSTGQLANDIMYTSQLLVNEKTLNNNNKILKKTFIRTIWTSLKLIRKGEIIRSARSTCIFSTEKIEQVRRKASKRP